MAGVIMNAVTLLSARLYLSEMMELLDSRGIHPPHGASHIAVYLLMRFIWGFVAVWFYVSARPRFGPGPQDSAACRIRVLVGRSIPGSCQLQHDGHVSNRHAWSMGGDHPCGILARQSLEPGSIASRSVPPNMAVQPTACGGGCMPIR